MANADILPCGCWYWMGARSRGAGNRKWYGSFTCKGKTLRAHRFSHIAIGGARDNLEIVHYLVNQARRWNKGGLLENS